MLTGYEKEEFLKWNRNITLEEEQGDKTSAKILEKYLHINNRRSCNPATFIYEIANTSSLPVEERIHDIAVYVSHLEADAKAKALSDILHIQGS